jgi:D-alanyl-D-alanine carboxypeptidase
VRQNPFDKVLLEAKSAFVWDVINQRPLYQKNADSPRPLASLAKVMTALTANSLAVNDVTINLSDLAPEGDSELKVGSDWNIKNLIDYVLLVSSNDGAHALAASAGLSNEEFVSRMNRKAQEIGLAQSSFQNEHGLDTTKSQSGAYGSARDMALLFEYAIKNYPHLLEATRYFALPISDQSNDHYLAKNTNEIINFIPSPIASKTGSTELAGGNLVVAFDAGLGRPIIVSILGSSEKGRFDDMLKLVSTTMAYLQQE